MSVFSDKVAIITGGASGIGRAIGEQLAREGAKVVLADINHALAESTALSIGAANGRAFAKRVDVGDAEAVRALMDEVQREHGRIDYLFNNAGIALFGEVQHMTLEQWDRILRVNLHGVVHGTIAAYPKMIEQGFGHIINTASLAGLVPQPGLAAYAMTKHGVVGLSIALRGEAKAYGVKVSALCPGLIDTPLVDSSTYLQVDKNKILQKMPIKLAPVDYCARVTLAGVRKNRAIITVTALARLAWWLNRFAPEFCASWLGPKLIARSRKEFGR